MSTSETSLTNSLAEIQQGPMSVELFLDEGLNEQYNGLCQRLKKRLPDLLKAFLAQAKQEKIPENLGISETQTWEVAVTFVCNETIAMLNKQYRDKDTATDVLSFPGLADIEDGIPWDKLPTVQLGEIFISIDWALSETGNNLDSDVLDRYILERLTHGLLHIMGVHHDTMEDYESVVRFQKQVLDEIF